MKTTTLIYYIVLVADCIMFTIIINLAHGVLFYLCYLKGGYLHVFETGYVLRTGNLISFLGKHLSAETMLWCLLNVKQRYSKYSPNNGREFLKSPVYSFFNLQCCFHQDQSFQVQHVRFSTHIWNSIQGIIVLLSLYQWKRMGALIGIGVLIWRRVLMQ